jgi:hypothetical protein
MNENIIWPSLFSTLFIVWNNPFPSPFVCQKHLLDGVWPIIICQPGFRVNYCPTRVWGQGLCRTPERVQGPCPGQEKYRIYAYFIFIYSTGNMWKIEGEKVNIYWGIGRV